MAGNYDNQMHFISSLDIHATALPALGYLYCGSVFVAQGETVSGCVYPAERVTSVIYNQPDYFNSNRIYFMWDLTNQISSSWETLN